MSLAFGIGIVRIDRPLSEVRAEIQNLHREVELDPLLNTIPSVTKRVGRGGFFFQRGFEAVDFGEILHGIGWHGNFWIKKLRILLRWIIIQKACCH